MEVQGVTILLSGPWVPGSVTLSEDIRQLAVYLEKARWVTAGSRNLGSRTLGST